MRQAFLQCRKEFKAAQRLIKQINMFDSNIILSGEESEEDESEGGPSERKERRGPAIEIPADDLERERLLKSEQLLDEKYRQLQEFLVRWPVALYDVRECSYSIQFVLQLENDNITVEKLRSKLREEQLFVTRFLSSNTVEAVNPRTPAEEVSLYLSSITDFIQREVEDMGKEHDLIMIAAEDDRNKEARQIAIRQFGREATREQIEKVLASRPAARPEFRQLSLERVLEEAGSADITASLRSVPKLSGRTSHPMARVAHAIMCSIGLHFTAPGHTTRLVDTLQQPNVQGVSSFNAYDYREPDENRISSTTPCSCVANRFNCFIFFPPTRIIFHR
jgi:hypothetical protein